MLTASLRCDFGCIIELFLLNFELLELVQERYQKTQFLFSLDDQTFKPVISCILVGPFYLLFVSSLFESDP